MRTEQEQKERDLELDKLRKADVGTVMAMGCIECEGLEEHTKLEGGTWKCSWCGAEVIKLA